mmetsp:Transcript_62693/g.180346  ORF Transcript_62693/g.180346 Transcript_62693/m.180346 type:complete len:200 (-) Transcript_62693:1479-2078(-)
MSLWHFFSSSPSLSNFACVSTTAFSAASNNTFAAALVASLAARSTCRLQSDRWRWWVSRRRRINASRRLAATSASFFRFSSAMAALRICSFLGINKDRSKSSNHTFASSRAALALALATSASFICCMHICVWFTTIFTSALLWRLFCRAMSASQRALAQAAAASAAAAEALTRTARTASTWARSRASTSRASDNRLHVT